MALRARVVSSRPVNRNRPDFILWEGTLIFEDPAKPDERGNPSMLLKVETTLRAWSGGSFLAMPQAKEAYIAPDGTARLRDRVWRKNGEPVLNAKGKQQYTPLVTISRALNEMGTAAVLAFLASPAAADIPDYSHGAPSGPTRVPSPGDLREAAQQTFAEMGGLDEAPMPEPKGEEQPTDEFDDLPF